MRSSMTLLDVHHGALLIDDGAGLVVGRLGRSPVADPFSAQENYRDRKVLRRLEPEGCGGPRALTWEPVQGRFAGLRPTAMHMGDQLIMSGLASWSVHSPSEETTLAIWSDIDNFEVGFPFVSSPYDANVATVLSGKESLRKVTLSQTRDCGWDERQSWAVELSGERVLTSAAFNSRGQAGIMVVVGQPDDPTRSSVRLGGEQAGGLILSDAYELPRGFSWAEHTQGGVRVDADGRIRGAFLGHVPNVGWSLFEVIWGADSLRVEQTVLPVSSVIVGRVDYDGGEPMWVVRTAEGEMGSGHRDRFDELCPVPEIVLGAPFMGGGTIAWQRVPGSHIQVGLCEWVPIPHMLKHSLD